MLFIIGTVLLVLCHGVICSGAGADVPFEQYYDVIFGNDHVKFLNPERTEVQLSLNKSYGSGFGSKSKFESGLFEMNLKLTPNDSAGVVTTFYLHSGVADQANDTHDEVDLEFLGNTTGQPIVLQTNVFANGVGEKEQRLELWFDPSADYHTYKILWNPHQIVIFIDETPVRVFKNNTALGVGFPTKPMQVLSTVWDGDDWATNGGRTKTNWSHAPFNVGYKGFNIDGCVGAAAPAPSPAGAPAPSSAATVNCSSTDLRWNQKGFWSLTAEQEQMYQQARKSLTYDYCTDVKRNPVPPVECENRMTTSTGRSTGSGSATTTTTTSSSGRAAGFANMVYFLLLVSVMKIFVF